MLFPPNIMNSFYWLDQNITRVISKNDGTRNSIKAMKKLTKGASLVAQWLRICLPMQGTRVRALVWEDPTCRGATGPVSHNY